jgi:hypothetical protein
MMSLGRALREKSCPRSCCSAAVMGAFGPSMIGWGRVSFDVLNGLRPYFRIPLFDILLCNSIGSRTLCCGLRVAITFIPLIT